MTNLYSNETHNGSSDVRETATNDGAAIDETQNLNDASENLELRAKPKPVRRINKVTLFLAIQFVLISLFGMIIWSLSYKNNRSQQQTELYNTDRKTKPEGLETLPKSYDQVPKLGPPFPGDLGRALKKAEKDLNIGVRQPFRPDATADLARAQRIRLARMAQQGRESQLFFRLNSKLGAAPKKTSDKKMTAASALTNPLSALSQLPASNRATLGLNPNRFPNGRDGDPGKQGRKLSFLNSTPSKAIYNPHGLQTPVSPYQLMAGTVISASLLSGLNSDLPGQVLAQVTEHVYDSVTGNHLLIPQGARLIGKYDSVVAFGQERALVVWSRIILPNGSSIVIDNLPASDEAGFAGLKDQVDVHSWQLLKGIALSTLLGVGSELTFGKSENELVTALRKSTQSNADRAGQKLVKRNLDVQPTLKVRPGWPLRVIVNKDVVLKPYTIDEAFK